jgi:hypothetical protein
MVKLSDLEQKARETLYVITWDNPKNPTSSGMFEALGKLGKVKTLFVKTTAVLSPKKHTTYEAVKETIQAELSAEKSRKGRAVIVSLEQNRIAHIDLSKDIKWKKGYPKAN